MNKYWINEIPSISPKTDSLYLTEIKRETFSNYFFFSSSVLAGLLRASFNLKELCVLIKVTSFNEIFTINMNIFSMYRVILIDLYNFKC